MSKSFGETPLPRYGLVGPYRDGWVIDGEGWDINSVVHSPSGAEGEVTVGVDRRTTARPVRSGPRVAIQPEQARKSVATALAVKLPGIGHDVFEVATQIAVDESAWRTCDIELDGQLVSGYQREYENLWIAYFLTPTLIIYVLAPISLRPDEVKLRKLKPSEVMRREDLA